MAARRNELDVCFGDDIACSHPRSFVVLGMVAFCKAEEELRDILTTLKSREADNAQTSSPSKKYPSCYQQLTQVASRFLTPPPPRIFTKIFATISAQGHLRQADLLKPAPYI